MSREKLTIQNSLQQSGLKVTSGRILLMSILSANHKPVSVSELVKKLGGRIDQATVYRNLLNLEQVGLVRRVEMKDDKSYFEIMDEHDHHHIICVSCGLIEDFYGCNIDNVVDNALKKSKQFSRINEHSMELFGLCKKCSKKLR
jgi:Fur family ferric uptake transcriptional regulator